MYKLINEISDRAFNSALRRGKSVDRESCINALAEELKEYWAACGTPITGYDQELTELEAIWNNDKQYVDYYNRHLHNTSLDEMADVFISAATLLHTAKEHTADLQHSVEYVLCCGPIFYICNIIGSPEEANMLRRAINAKLLYNDIRND